MVKKSEGLHVGDRIWVPWGRADRVFGTVVELWGDPPAHVRVALELEEDEAPEVVLLNPSVVKRVA